MSAHVLPSNLVMLEIIAFRRYGEVRKQSSSAALWRVTVFGASALCAVKLALNKKAYVFPLTCLLMICIILLLSGV